LRQAGGDTWAVGTVRGTLSGEYQRGSKGIIDTCRADTNAGRGLRETGAVCLWSRIIDGSKGDERLWVDEPVGIGLE